MQIAILLTCLMFAVCFGQQKQKYSIAVLPSINADYSEEKKLTAKELDFLTEKVREIATKVLPVNQFTLLKQNAVVERIGAEEYFKACKEGSCVGDLAKKISVDYAARCDVSNINDKFVLKFELYSVKDDATLGIFSDYANDIDDMRRMIEEKTPAEFKKIISSNSVVAQSPVVQGGIGSVETSTDGTLEYGNNFGFLEIKPAFKDGIGNDRQWNLSINGRAFSSMDNRLSLGNYEVKLSHECYENINFNIGINKGKSEIFDMLRYTQPKQGILILSAEKDDEPISESVFASGKRIGETPFSGSVPVCAEISIGESNDKVDVKLLYNQTVRHKHQISNKKSTSGVIFTDSRDSKKYKTVKIGTQTWMAENLNYNASGSKCYNNNSSNCDKYGRLYDWNTAMNSCPKGWHLPTNAEWDILYRSADGTSGTSSPYSSNAAGKHLKAKSDWNSSGNGLDTYGFTALPGGGVNSVTVFNRDGSSYDIGIRGNWWSASKYSFALAYTRYMYYGNELAYYRNSDRRSLFSVRCLQDD